jgi:perosamine synthetase
LDGIKVVLNPAPNESVTPGYWMVNATFPGTHMNVERREELIDALSAINADARVFFWPLTQTGHFESRTVNKVSKCVSSRSINLPTAFGMTEKMIEQVCCVVRKFAESPTEVPEV